MIRQQVLGAKRAFSTKERRQIYLLAGGICERCGVILDDTWQAHHIAKWSTGGHTAVFNGMALCMKCHKKIHGAHMNKIDPRGWQKDALAKFIAHENLCFLLDATPGAGKTYFSGFCVQEMMIAEKSLFVVAVVPTTVLKNSFQESFHDLGIEITTSLKSGRPKEFQGAAVTYQQLPNLITVFESWNRNGQKLVFIFDEIHHASEDNVWGLAVESCGDIAEKIIAMSGTPFRGDGRKISFVNYNSDGVAMSDASFTYREAVARNVCREVFFMPDDGEAEYSFAKNGNRPERIHCKVSEATNGEAYNVAKVIFKPGSQWLENVIFKANRKLDEYRAAFPNAGGIIVCRPGYDDTSSQKHLRPIAKMIEANTGHAPYVISHEDPDADSKIEAFRRSSEKWILSVRKISEGVDIKRLRVMVILSYPSTELLFRQLIGRVVRVENRNVNENATVLMAKFPQLVEWASTITEEARMGIKDREEERGVGDGSMEDAQKSMFTAHGCTHEDGGGISMFGNYYRPNEVLFAEMFKSNDPELSSVSVATIAHILKKAGAPIPEAQTKTKPLQKIKKEKRDEINRLVRQIAFKKKQHDGPPNFAQVWHHVNTMIGVRSIDDLFDNHSVEKMDSAIHLLEKMLQE